MDEQGGDWRASAFEETLLPGSQWPGVERELSKVLVEAASQYRVRDQTWQVFLSLMGDTWRQKHFPDADYTPMMLEPPYMSDAFRDSLASEIFEDLRRRLQGRFAAPMTDDPDTPPQAPEIVSYTRTVRDVYVAAADREWGRLHPQGDSSQDGSDADTEADTGAEAASEAVLMADYHATYGIGADRATRSEVLGDLVAHLLRVRDATDHGFRRLLGELIGSSLPVSLRQYAWEEGPLRVGPLGGVREHRSLPLLPGHAREVTPQVDALIRKAVDTIYTEGLAMLAEEVDESAHRERTCDVLNAMHAQGHEFAPRFVRLCFPLLVVFPDWDHLRLAALTAEVDARSRLDLSDLRADSEHALRLLRQHRPHLAAHINEIFAWSVNTPSIARVASQDALARRVAALKDPHVMVQYWLSAVFVGYTHAELLFFIWDQLFLMGFETLPYMALALLMALERPLLHARSPEGIFDVTENGLLSVFTLDVQQCLLSVIQIEAAT